MVGGCHGAAPLTARSDEALVEAVRDGEREAYAELFCRYRWRIARLVRSMVGERGTAEDVAQEVFLAALRRIRETNRPIAFKPWIYEIARNACIDELRRARRGEELVLDAVELAALPAPTACELAPEAVLARRQQLADLVGAFGGLSDAHHRIIVLRELEGLSYQEIGLRLGLSRPAVESTLFRARRRLGEEYDELASGIRCLDVQGLAGAAADGALGQRERRHVSRHLSHCGTCRRHAWTAEVVEAGRAVRAPGMGALGGARRSRRGPTGAARRR